MNKKKDSKKRNVMGWLLNNWLSIVGGILIIVGIIIDLVLKKSSSSFLDLNEVVFNAIIVFVGCWFTCYLLFVELYRDRYHLKNINKTYMPKIKGKMVFATEVLLIGGIVLLFDKFYLVNILFLILSGVLVMVITLDIVDSRKQLMVHVYIDSYCDDISKKINDNQNAIDSAVIKEIMQVLDECVVKEEFYAAQIIARKTGEVFRGFLRQSISLIDELNDDKTVEASYDMLINLGMEQIRICNSIPSKILKKEIIVQQYKNIKMCIDTNQYIWFKNYIDAMINLTFSAQKDDKKEVVDCTYEIYCTVLENLVEREYVEWVNYLVNKLLDMTESLNYIYNKNSIKGFAMFIANGMFCDNQEIVNILVKAFETFLMHIEHISGSFTEIKMYCAVYFNSIIKKGDVKRIEKFLDIVCGESLRRSFNQAWIEFRFYCIEQVQKEYKNINVGGYQKNLIREVIEMGADYGGWIMFPSYSQRIDGNKRNEEIITEIAEELEYFIEVCVHNNNMSFYWYILEQIKTLMLENEKNDLIVLKKLFGTIMYAVYSTSRIDNRQMLEISTKYLQESIEELDKNSLISEALLNYIIDELSSMASSLKYDNYSMINSLLGILADFDNEQSGLKIVIGSNEKKKRLYQKIYTVGVSCLESDYEEGVRRCSNALGWSVIRALEHNSNNQLAIYLLSLARALLEAAKIMGASEKTLTFIYTLFTTVGMYCCKQGKKNNVVLKEVLDVLEKDDRGYVGTAITIRTFENDMWDELLDNNRNACVSELRREISKRNKKLKA